MSVIIPGAWDKALALVLTCDSQSAGSSPQSIGLVLSLRNALAERGRGIEDKEAYRTSTGRRKRETTEPRVVHGPRIGERNRPWDKDCAAKRRAQWQYKETKM